MTQIPPEPNLPNLPPSVSNLPPDEPTPILVPSTPVVSAPAAVKAGYTTTEFWITSIISVAAVAVGTVLFLLGDINQTALVQIITIGGATPTTIYTVFRSILKMIAPQIVLPDASS